MPPPADEILTAGAAAGEKFVADSIAMDKAFREGKFHEWFAAYVAEHISNVNSNGDTGTDPQAER